MAILMRCAHCDTDSELMPGWKHEDRPADAHGTIEHLWWAIFPEGGHRFAAGVSVKRGPSDVLFDGRPVMTWKLRCLPSTSAIEGAAHNVVLGAVKMVGTDSSGEDSLIVRWAARLNYKPRAPRCPLPAEDYVAPF